MRTLEKSWVLFPMLIAADGYMAKPFADDLLLLLVRHIGLEPVA